MCFFWHFIEYFTLNRSKNRHTMLSNFSWSRRFWGASDLPHSLSVAHLLSTPGHRANTITTTISIAKSFRVLICSFVRSFVRSFVYSFFILFRLIHHCSRHLVLFYQEKTTKDTETLPLRLLSHLIKFHLAFLSLYYVFCSYILTCFMFCFSCLYHHVNMFVFSYY